MRREYIYRIRMHWALHRAFVLSNVRFAVVPRAFIEKKAWEDFTIAMLLLTRMIEESYYDEQ